MKLKKIASLMLAGIMAVSMLAGCKDNGSSSTPNEPTEPVASGLSAMLADAMDKDLVEKDYIHFVDGTDEVALKSATEVIGKINLFGYGETVQDAKLIRWVSPLVPVGSQENVAAEFEDKADLDHYYGTDGAHDFFVDSDDLNKPFKSGIIYVVDGSITNMSAVMKEIAGHLDSELGDWNMPENGTVEGTNEQNTEYDFDYNIAVSVVNVPNELGMEFNYSYNFISVTITRTATNA